MGQFIHIWPSSIRGVWHLAFLWSCNCSFGVSLGFGCTLQDESNRLLSTFIEKLKLYSYWARNHTHAGLHIRLREIWIIHFEDAGHSAHFMHIQIIEGQIYKVSTDIWQNSNPSRTKTIFPIAYLCCRLKLTKLSAIKALTVIIPLTLTLEWWCLLCNFNMG